MNISENLTRIKQGKDDIITALQNKGSDIQNDTLISEISTYVDKLEIGGGGGDTPSVPTELVPKYDGASVFRIVVPENDYEFAINLCNDATKATYDVDWGDGSLESGLTTDEQHHIYSKAGTYDVNVYNLSKDITLGGKYDIDNGTTYKISVYYLFNNTNNDYWGRGQYIENKDYICTNIVIGKGVTSIDSSAFQSCSSLQSVDLPSTLTSIGSSAFDGCSSLQSIVIPEGVTSIGGTAFYQCSSLQSIVIPEGVTSIGNNVFNGCSSLQSVDLPSTLTSIGSNAFNKCTSLQSVDLPSTLTSIDSNAFDGCSSLQSIVIPEGVTYTGDSIFRNCSSLQSIVIPEGVTSISSSAFQSCSSLQSVDLPSTLTSIGSNAFNKCSSLQSIVIPEGVTSISSSVFTGCSSLQSITCNSDTPPTFQSSSFSTSGFKYSKRYLYVPKDSVGYNEGNWKTYLIDKGWELRYIEEYEKTPTTLKLKSTNNFFHNLQAIGQAKLIDYELINNEYIYNFDDKITELHQYTFYNKVLEEIELPEGLEIISQSTFNGCSSLQSIVIPEGITRIEMSTFSSCSSLSNIEFPNTLTFIGMSAFSGCTAVHTFICRAMVAPTVANTAFQNVGTKVPSGTPKVLRVPEGSDYSTWKSQLSGFTIEYFKL